MSQRCTRNSDHRCATLIDESSVCATARAALRDALRDALTRHLARSGSTHGSTMIASQNAP